MGVGECDGSALTVSICHLSYGVSRRVWTEIITHFKFLPNVTKGYRYPNL
jgi:hypothetical protein